MQRFIKVDGKSAPTSPTHGFHGRHQH
uniref:Uncharacterized protein n=1 Tax=Anguilla anguilla TaxID=7936 RepID=A0A0E9Q1X5_ANGAN